MAKFRLLHGRHVGDDPGGKPDRQGNRPQRLYAAGVAGHDVIDVPDDSGEAKFFAGDPDKFMPEGAWAGGQQAAAELTALREENARLQALLAAAGQAVPVTSVAAAPPPAAPAVSPPPAPPGPLPLTTPAGRAIERDYGDLNAMTVADLRELAAAEEIDLAGATTKADIVKAIRAAK